MKAAENIIAGKVAEPTLTFWGAAGGVTGSMHLLEVGNHKVLLDCGLHQGRREEARQRNGHFPFHPHQIDAVILSHAHIDHCGNLPTLVRQGFDGPIYCTPPTRDLLRVMLADSRQDPGGGRGAPQHRPQLRRAVGAAAVHPHRRRAGVQPGRAGAVRQGDRRHRERAVPVHRGRAHPRLGDGPPHRRRAGPRPHADASAATWAAAGCRSSSRPATSRRRTCWCARAPTATACTARSPRRWRSCTRRSATRSTEDGKVLIPAFSLGRTQLIIHVLQQGLREREDSADPDLRRQPAGVGGGRGLPGAPEQPLARDRPGAAARGTGCSAATA